MSGKTYRWRCPLILVLSVWAVAVHDAAGSAAQMKCKEHGCFLYEAIFHGTAPPALAKDTEALRGYPAFRQRYLAFSPAKTTGTNAPWEMRQSQAKRQALERAAFAFSGERHEAARLAAALPIGYEWEGMAEGPLAEARAAERYLQQHPGTSLHAFIRLFAAQRYRAAAEASASRGDFTGESEHWLFYRKHLSAVLALDQPLINLVAQAMTGRPQVYLALPKAVLCRETANGVPFFSPSQWLHTCLGDGEVTQFEIDIDGDALPERFAALSQEIGNAGGPFHVFRHHPDSWTYFGKIDVHPQAVRRLPEDTAGRPQLERYWRTGAASATIDVFVHDGIDFRLVESRPATAEDRKRFGFKE